MVILLSVDGLSEDSGRGEDDTEATQHPVLATQVVTVDMSSLANKTGKDIGPSGGNKNHRCMGLGLLGL